MLIIEGPDGVGKSTLLDALLRMWHSNAKAYGPWPLCPQRLSRCPDSWHHYKSYLPLITRQGAWDRFHLSEIAYGTVCRGRVGISPEWLRLIEARLALTGSVTVVLTAPAGRLIDEYQSQTAAGKREMFSSDQVVKVNRFYRDCLVGGDDDRWRHAHVDFHYDIGDSGWAADNESWMDSVLRELSSRLGALFSLDGARDFYGPPNKECEP